MTRCDHGIPHATGCDECDEAEITWPEEYQRELICSRDPMATGFWRAVFALIAAGVVIYLVS